MRSGAASCGGGTRRRQQASAAVYDRARLFRIYEPSVVPGLLQTRGYAVAVLSVFTEFVRVPDDAEQGAAARLDRQRVLTHGDRRFHMVLGEQALYTNVGGADVMAGQLEHLLAVEKLPRLRIGIIPAGAPYACCSTTASGSWMKHWSSSIPTALRCPWSGPTRSRCTDGPSSAWRPWPSTAPKPGRW